MTQHRLSRRTATTTRFSPKGCQKQTVPRFCQHLIRWAFTSQAFTRWRHLSTHPIKQACYSFIDPGQMKDTATQTHRVQRRITSSSCCCVYKQHQLYFAFFTIIIFLDRLVQNYLEMFPITVQNCDLDI